ncbi:hypothetical protein D3C76_1589090 [compost metagenome]
MGVIRPGVDDALGALDLVGGVEPVEEHLPQSQFRLGVIEDFGVVITQRPSVGVVAVPAPVGGIEVHRWIKTALGDFHVFISRQTAVHPRCEFRVGRDSALDRFGQ